MNNLSFLFCSLAILLFFSLSQASDVKVLTPDNFDSVVDGSKHVFVEFFAPWCGHCKKLAPDYEIVATAFAKTDSVVVASVDADAHKDLASKFGVTGYPTLKFFPKGSTEPESYSGARDPDGLIEYINNKAGTSSRVSKPPSFVVDLTPSNFDEIVLDEGKHAIVEFFAPWCGHCKKLAPTWDKLGEVFKSEEGVVIGKVDADKHKDLGGKYGVQGFPTIVVFSKDNKEGVKYEGARELSDFVEYINKEFGTHRTEFGRLDENAGTIESLAELAVSFVSNKDERDEILEKAGNVIGELDGTVAKDAGYYVKVMKALAKRGEDFASTEIERLERMVSSGNIKAGKEDEFVKRINILNQFIAKEE